MLPGHALGKRQRSKQAPDGSLDPQIILGVGNGAAPNGRKWRQVLLVNAGSRLENGSL